MDIILERIQKRLERQNNSQKDLADFLRRSENVVSAWFTGKTTSYTKYLYQIAAFLHTTPEYLRGETDSPDIHVGGNVNNVGGDVNGTFIGGSVAVSSAPMTDDERALVDCYRALSPINRAKILVHAEELKNEQNKSTQK